MPQRGDPDTRQGPWHQRIRGHVYVCSMILARRGGRTIRCRWFPYRPNPRHGHGPFGLNRAASQKVIPQRVLGYPGPSHTDITPVEGNEGVRGRFTGAAHSRRGHRPIGPAPRPLPGRSGPKPRTLVRLNAQLASRLYGLPQPRKAVLPQEPLGRSRGMTNATTTLTLAASQRRECIASLTVRWWPPQRLPVAPVASVTGKTPAPRH